MNSDTPFVPCDGKLAHKIAKNVIYSSGQNPNLLNNVILTPLPFIYEDLLKLLWIEHHADIFLILLLNSKLRLFNLYDTKLSNSFSLIIHMYRCPLLLHNSGVQQCAIKRDVRFLPVGQVSQVPPSSAPAPHAHIPTVWRDWNRGLPGKGHVPVSHVCSWTGTSSVTMPRNV